MQARRTLWVDVTTLAGWRGHATGIARTLSQLLHHWLADDRLPLRLCRFDGVRRVYHAVEASQVIAPRTARGSDEPAVTSGWPSLNTARLPGELREAGWHLGQAAKSLGRLARSAFRKAVASGHRTAVRLRKPMPGVHFAPGDVLLLGGASWKDSPGPDVLQHLRGAGVEVASIVYDITPLRCPHLCSPDLTRAIGGWLPGVLSGSDLVLTISDHSRRDLEEYGQQQAMALPPIEKLRLGDEPGEDDGETAPADLVSRAPGPFVLYVSTLGLNKNHQMLFHVWRRLIDRHGGGVPTLVLAGGPGWRADQLLRDLRDDPALSRHVRHLARASDRQLRWLYRRCLFTVYPSHYEGWGLPVAEGLALGKYCVSSNAASLPEVGGALVDYHDPLDGASALALIEKALLEPGWLASREDRVRREYRATSWRDCARQTFEILDRRFGLAAKPSRREAA